MPNFLTVGKEKCRRLWLEHSEGNVLLLSAEDMLDALDLARSGVGSVTCPEHNDEIHWKKLTALRAAGASSLPIRVVSGDYTQHVEPRYNTYIPDLQVGWCEYTKQLLARICSMDLPHPTVLFLTLTRYQPTIARFGTKEDQRFYGSKKRTLHTVRQALEQFLRRQGIVAVPIEGSIFQYHGTPSNKKGLKQPNMLHFGYKLTKLYKGEEPE
jgi:hypothetical protein